MIQGHGDDLYAYAGGIRLNFSSNILSSAAAEWLPPTMVQGHQGLRRHLNEVWCRIGNYPEPEPLTAEADIAQWLGIAPSEVLLTNGATEAIYLLANEYGALPYRVEEPTFSEYKDAMEMAKGCGQKVEGIASVYWLCNPNNPTGHVTPKRELEHLVDSHPDTLFIIDQSYECFTLEQLFTPREACERPNLVLLHSMTKQFGIPGLRVGYITASRSLLEPLRQRRCPWAIGTLISETARYLCCHADDYALPLTDILKERARVGEALTATGLMDVHPSQTHMLLCRLHEGRASELKERLARQHGILIRDASNFQGLTPAHFRIAVQGREADDALIQAILYDI